MQIELFHCRSDVNYNSQITISEENGTNFLAKGNKIVRYIQDNYTGERKGINEKKGIKFIFIS